MNIELRHIHKRFGAVHANNDVNLNFRSGRIYGVLGENGAGKSTLMKILSGYQPADSGEIRFDGALVDYRSPQAALRAGVGMLQQDPLDVGAFSVLENFVFGPLSARGLNGRAARAELARVSGRFGFDLDPELPITQVSIGGRQQLEIARLLALGVKALILDEPTTGISAEQKQTLFDALKQLARKDGMTILLVSHKLEDVISLCDEVAVLRAGQLVGKRALPATPAELVEMMFGQVLSPAERPRVDLSGAAPVVTLEKASLRSKRLHVEGLSLALKAGEIVGLAGLDGSGQELLLRACAGLVKLTDGRIRLHDQDMTGQSYRQFLAAGVAFAAAGRLEEGLVAGLTLTEHIALSTGTQPLVQWERARAQTAQLIQRYNVRGQPESQIQQLSGGNQQRMLMALMPEHPLLLALEQPTRGLDVDSARWIWQQLLERRDKGAAILFASPDLDELVTYSDRILVFYAGRATEISPVHPQTTSVEMLGRLIGGHFDEVQH
jgi:general nucleoside transport system ATP-binding protein